MKREDIFEAARVAEFTRVSECCPGVELKLCANDQWKGDLGAFVTQIEMRVIQRCIDFIRNGSFLSDDSPPKRFADEVTAEMERQLMPKFELSPEVLREMMRPMSLNAFSDMRHHFPRDQMFRGHKTDRNPIGAPLGSPDNPVRMTEELPLPPVEFVPTDLVDIRELGVLPKFVPTSVEGTSTEDPGTIRLGAKYGDARGVSEVPFVREDAVPITYAQAIELFKMHLTSHFLKTGKSPEAIAELLAVEVQTPTQEIRALVDRLLEQANARGGVKVGRRPQSEYAFGYDQSVKVYITDTPEVGEDGVKKND